MKSTIPAAPGGLPCYVYDLEVFPNYFLACFKGPRGWQEFTHASLPALVNFICDPVKVLAGFNNFAYDDVILMAIAGKGGKLTPADIFALSKTIIDPGPSDRPRLVRLQYGETPWAYSIDFFQLMNGKGSLKEWECRNGYDHVKDSPADFMADLPASAVEDVRRYCRHDVEATADFLAGKWDLVLLREKLAKTFDLDRTLYRRTEAQIAEHVFITLHQRRCGLSKSALKAKMDANPVNAKTSFPLSEIIHSTVEFQDLAQDVFLETLKRGRICLSKSWGLDVPGLDLSKPLTLCDVPLQFGAGGLHSVDGPGIFDADEQNRIVDLDVTSYYPSIMLNLGLFPAHIGKEFLEDFRRVRDIRVKAKRDGDKVTAEALKIVINSTFGKLNDTYSPLRSTPDAHRVTVNGQLYLLMLVEAIWLAGGDVLSVNTDGVTLRAAAGWVEKTMPDIVKRWERATGFTLEATHYARVCRRDVNNYLAMTTDGKIKRKGEFSDTSGKADGVIVREAAEAALLKNIPPAAVVVACTDPRKFLYYQRVKNGGQACCGATVIGKTVRWFAGVVGDPIRRLNPKGTYAVLPCGGRGVLAMDIDGWTMADMCTVDLEHYTTEALALVGSCSPPPPKPAKIPKGKK